MNKTRSEYFMLFFVLMQTIATVAQAAMMWTGEDTDGVSPVIWVIYTLPSIAWLINGTSQKNKLFILSGIYWHLHKPY